MDPNTELLTVEECAAVDAALLTTHGKFNARVAIYALRLLKQIAAETDTAITNISPEQIITWVESDPQVQASNDKAFRQFWAKLVLSARQPLNQAADLAQVNLGGLTVAQVIQYFEQQAKAQISVP
jgi:hypothetical protein